MFISLVGGCWQEAFLHQSLQHLLGAIFSLSSGNYFPDLIPLDILGTALVL